MGSAEDEFEREAKRVLQHLLGGSVVDRDTRGAQGVRDFDLVDSAEAVAHAVEVTSVQLPAARATRSGMERLRAMDLGLTASWDIFVHEEAPTRPIEQRAAPTLNLLHAHGVDEFDALDPPTDPDLAQAVVEIADMCIPRGRVMPGASPPRLYPGTFGSGTVDPSNLTGAIEAEAHKDDNRRKLSAAPAGAVRHLFVWLHDSHWYVSSLLRSPSATPPAPLLPTEVEVVWAAVGDGPGPLTCSALLRSARSEWVQLDPTSGAVIPPTSNEQATGPPTPPPRCPLCNGPSRWERWTVDRTHRSGVQSVVQAWRAVCAEQQDHWVMPGRDLSAAELHALPPNE